MAIAADTSLTYSSVAIREDLSDVISNISPMDTPFMSGCGKEKADNTYFQWQTDTIGAGGANRVIEGDDSPAAVARALPTKVGNYTQISRYVVQTSGTDDVVDYAGHGKHQAYRLAKRGKQMKRDMEYMFTQNIAQVAGNATLARASAGLPSWLVTNYVSMGGSGSPAAPTSGGGVAAATDAGSVISITEAKMKEVIKDCYDSGGNPDTVLCKPDIKQAISGLSSLGVTTLNTDLNSPKPGFAVGAVDVYVSDFGNFKIVPDRNQNRSRDVFFLDMDFWAIAWLRDFHTVDLAKQGDSTKQMLIGEFGLVSKNEAASGVLSNCDV
jgi:hypothetical protein